MPRSGRDCDGRMSTTSSVHLQDVARPCWPRPGDLSAGPDNPAGDGRTTIDEQPHGDRGRVPSACRQTTQHRRSGKHRVEMEGLRVEPARELDDLRLAERVRAADEPLPDAQIIKVNWLTGGRRRELGHQFLSCSDRRAS